MVLATQQEVHWVLWVVVIQWVVHCPTGYHITALVKGTPACG